MFNEIRILRQVNHPNCIKMHSTYEDDCGYFIVTELLNTEKSLKNELEKFQNPSFALTIIRSIVK